MIELLREGNFLPGMWERDYDVGMGRKLCLFANGVDAPPPEDDRLWFGRLVGEDEVPLGPDDVSDLGDSACWRPQLSGSGWCIEVREVAVDVLVSFLREG